VFSPGGPELQPKIPVGVSWLRNFGAVVMFRDVFPAKLMNVIYYNEIAFTLKL
jgi:hypothetical protein